MKLRSVLSFLKISVLRGQTVLSGHPKTPYGWPFNTGSTILWIPLFALKGTIHLIFLVYVYGIYY